MLLIIFFYLYIAIAVILIISSFKAKKLRLLFIPPCIAWIAIPIYRMYPIRREPYIDNAKVIIEESDKYSYEEINSAINCVKNFIHQNDDHCKLLKIEFTDDKEINDFKFKHNIKDEYIIVTAYIHYGIKSEWWTYDNAETSNIMGNIVDKYILFFDSSVGEWKIYAC